MQGLLLSSGGKGRGNARAERGDDGERERDGRQRQRAHLQPGCLQRRHQRGRGRRRLRAHGEQGRGWRLGVTKPPAPKKKCCTA